MKTKAFKLLPCVFCAIGYNCYIDGHNITAKGYQSLVKLQNKKPEVGANWQLPKQ